MGVLHYRDPATREWIPIIASGGSDEGGGPTGSVVAGLGLSGGGAVIGNPSLNVGQGTGISVAADSVAVNKTTLDTWYAPVNDQSAVTITDWNLAVNNNTAYMSSGAAHAPDTGWFYGICLSHNASYKHQLLFPFANARWNAAQMWEREMENGVWGDWSRVGTYAYSRDTLDAGVFAQHNASYAVQGVRRSFWGVVKDKGTNNPSNLDAWRVTYYDTAGNYTGRAIDIPLGTGVVSHPQGHSTTMSALRTRAPIAADTAATVGVVMEIVANALASAGIDINPTAVARLIVEAEDDEMGESPDG